MGIVGYNVYYVETGFEGVILKRVESEKGFYCGWLEWFFGKKIK